MAFQIYGGAERGTAFLHRRDAVWKEEPRANSLEVKLCWRPPFPPRLTTVQNPSEQNTGRAGSGTHIL